MGARLAGADGDLIDALTTYAYNLGLTFQIVDDLLDIIGDPEKMGKPVGTDLAQNRGVLTAQNGGTAVMEEGNVATATAVAEADPFTAMMARLRDSGAVDVARLQAMETAQRARAALANVPPSPMRKELDSLIDLVRNRDK